MTNLIALVESGAIMQQTAMSIGKVPWYVFWGSVSAPQMLAILLTMTAIVVWRRVNRADGRPEIKAGTLVVFTLLVGGVFGSVFQWGMQEMVAHVTGVSPSYKAVILSFVGTGLMTMASYELIKWWALKKQWLGLHALLSVKHKSADGDCGDTPDGDVTLSTLPPKDYPE